MGRPSTRLLALLLATASSVASAQPGAFGSDATVARAQLMAGEYETAVTLAETRIAAIEAAHRQYHPELVEPLTILGDARVGLDDFAGAVAAYERARHVARVNEGLYNLGQVDVLYREARAHLLAGDLPASNDAEEHAYQILLQVHGDSAGLIRGQTRLADWYRDNGYYNVARWMYRDTMDLVDRHAPESALIRLALAGRYAATFRMQRFPPYKRNRGNFQPRPGGRPWTTLPGAVRAMNSNVREGYMRGRRAFEVVIDQTRVHRTDDAGAVARALINLGDWHLLYTEYNRALRTYAEAHATLDATDPAAAAEAFAAPELLYMPFPGNPSRPPNSSAWPMRDGRVELTLSVDHRGIPVEVATTDVVPADVVTIKYVRATRLARYRPALRAGEAVRVDGIKVVHTFQYASRD